MIAIPNTLPVNEIFVGVSGEVGKARQGSFMTFIRFDGCNLACSFCDTPDTQKGDNHKNMTVDDIVDTVQFLGCRQVLLTGGEPLTMDLNLLVTLCLRLQSMGCLTSVETNGSINPMTLPALLTDSIDGWIIDVKLPSSGCPRDQLMSLQDYATVPYQSWLKFVICTEDDYRIARSMVRSHELRYRSDLQFAFSPCPPMIPDDLFQVMKDDQLFEILFNVQIHKLAKLNEK